MDPSQPQPDLLLEEWFDQLRRDPNVIKTGRVVGASLGLGALETLTVVVDTNLVLAEISYLARHPGSAVTRASVPRFANSGVLCPICPPLLEEEVRRYLPRFAARAGCSLGAIEVIWAEYRVHLRFVEVVPAFTPAVRYVESRDPNDVDFVHVQEFFGVDAILTSDKHLLDSPAPAIDPQDLLKTLGAYEQAKRYKFALVLGGWTFVLSGSLGLNVLVKVVSFLCAAFRRLPWYVQCGVALAAAYGLTRLKKAQLRRIISSLRPLVEGVAREALGHATEASKAEKRATTEFAAARDIVPLQRGPRRLRPTLRRVLLEKPEGVTEGQLARAVIAHGYKTSAKDLASYIGGVLRSEPGAVFFGGRWRWRTGNVDVDRAANPRRDRGVQALDELTITKSRVAPGASRPRYPGRSRARSASTSRA